jgi:hypothetical protein
MIKVKEKYKGYNVPYKDKTLGTLQGDDLKKYIKAFLYSKKPNDILIYFDNTIEELTEFAESASKKAIKKPVTPEIKE